MEEPLDLGWMNDTGEIGKRIDKYRAKCRALGHITKNFDRGPANRGLENVVICKACNYVYRYDSSD